MKYDHQQIEAKWQKFWLENKTFKTENESPKPKYYILDMFPYPSGAGFACGTRCRIHSDRYLITLYEKERGIMCCNPMGWDSFGLPAEQYAIRTGTHPAISTQANIDTYRRQPPFSLALAMIGIGKLQPVIPHIINGLNGFLPNFMRKGLPTKLKCPLTIVLL